ncbi:hypothetical protein NCC49_002989 [Naganishia albida]|nr:hypothetical protein NCC49_002989 [Naganishia albida]
MSTHIPATATATVRQSILSAATSLVREHSFTRRAILSAITHHPDGRHFQDPAGLIEPLFGTGVEPERALVREWERQGLHRMREAFEVQPEGEAGRSVVVARRGKGKAREVDFEAVKRALGERIKWSSETAGEHLVQAHALLATPLHTLSAALPKPLTTIASALGTTFRLDRAYLTPEEEQCRSGTPTQQLQSPPPPPSAPRATLPVVNPVPLLRYAGRIADEALYVSGAEPETVSGELDWYTRRIGLALIYIHAETHLLRPRTRTAHATSADPQLSAALGQLDTSMERYRAISRADARLGEVERQVAQFAGFVWKSWGGLFRSRGWIN